MAENDLPETEDDVQRARSCWCGLPAKGGGLCADHATFDRVWPLADIEIVRSGSGGDGRTVDAYVSVFDAETEVKDQWGHYRETIHRAAFARALNVPDLTSRVTVLLNHGLTMDGQPAPLGSIPIGVPIDIRADGKGLRTRTRYNSGEYADAVLESIKNGGLRGHSFRGRVYKSTPDRVPRIQRGGQLPLITRMELGLSEYGPTPIPYYADASVVAIRSRAIAEAQRLPLRERIVLARALLEPVAGPDEDDPQTPDSTPEPETVPDEGTDTPVTPDPGSEEDTEGQDPTDDSPTPDDSGLGTEDPDESDEDDEPLPPVESARSRVADFRRQASTWRITRGRK